MNKSEQIIHALQAQPVPDGSTEEGAALKMPSSDQLNYLISKRLSGTAASSLIFENFLQDKARWTGAMLEVINTHHLQKDPEIMAEAFGILRYTEELHPIHNVQSE